EQDLSETAREFLQNIASLAERAASLTRQMLAFARKPALVRRPICLRTHAYAAAELVTRTMHVAAQVEDSAPPRAEELFVEVEAHGCGMTPEVMSQALDPFFTAKPVGQGTGLGLPVVFGIVRGHQGFLAIESEPGHGTRVGIFLPRLVNPSEGRARFDYESG